MISPELINDFSGAQNQIWQTISLSVCEAINQNVSFSSPLTVATKTTDLYAELAAPMVIVQFSFSDLPESIEAMLLPGETAIAFAEAVTGNKVPAIDDNILSELRPALEAIVQGLCIAAGTLLGETIVASGLTIRHQIFAMPPNLQGADELARTEVAITGEGLSGSAIWLIDQDSVRYLLGVGLVEEEASQTSPFPQVGATEQVTTLAGIVEENGIDRLLDVPLEISVELGRVKMLVKDVIELGTGSIVEIEKSAGEPVDVMVNGRLVARGEVVVIEDNFGVRVTEILNPQDRLARLNEAA